MTSNVKEILEVWNPWWETGEVPKTLKGETREVTSTISKWLGNRHVKVLIGPRRTGKTTVMYQLIDKIIRERPPTSAVYINFEDPEIQDIGFKRVYAEAKKISGKNGVLFLDEIQSIERWDSYIRAIVDRRDPVDLVISGSTLAMVGKEFSKRLAGRTIMFRVYPLSLIEAAKIKDITPEDPRFADAFKGLIEEAMTTGLYPEIFMETDPSKKKQLLIEYYDSIVARDIAAGHDLDVEKSDEIARYLLRNTGTLTSVNKLANIFKVSFHTMEKYVNAFLDSMVFFEVRQYSHSLREQLAKPKKFYPIDLGFRWAVSKGPSPDIGRLFETLIGQEIVKTGKKVFYWKNSGECDYIIVADGKPITGIQATLDISKPREWNGLLKAAGKLDMNNLMVVTPERRRMLEFIRVLGNGENP